MFSFCLFLSVSIHFFRFSMRSIPNIFSFFLSFSVSHIFFLSFFLSVLFFSISFFFSFRFFSFLFNTFPQRNSPECVPLQILTLKWNSNWRRCEVFKDVRISSMHFRERIPLVSVVWKPFRKLNWGLPSLSLQTSRSTIERLQLKYRGYFQPE